MVSIQLLVLTHNSPSSHSWPLGCDVATVFDSWAPYIRVFGLIVVWLTSDKLVSSFVERWTCCYLKLKARWGCGGTWPAAYWLKWMLISPQVIQVWDPCIFFQIRVTEHKIIYAAVCIYTHLTLMSFIKIWSIYDVLFPYGYATLSFPWSHLFMFNEIIQNLKKGR